MKTAASFLTVIALAAGAAPALATPRMSDSEYLAAVRCRALAAEQAMDTAALDARLKAEKRGRHNYVADRAGDAERDARREAKRGGEMAKMQITAELQGSCRAFLSTGDNTALALRG